MEYKQVDPTRDKLGMKLKKIFDDLDMPRYIVVAMGKGTKDIGGFSLVQGDITELITLMFMLMVENADVFLGFQSSIIAMALELASREGGIVDIKETKKPQSPPAVMGQARF